MGALAKPCPRTLLRPNTARYPPATAMSQQPRKAERKIGRLIRHLLAAASISYLVSYRHARREHRTDRYGPERGTVRPGLRDYYLSIWPSSARGAEQGLPPMTRSSSRIRRLVR